MPEARWRRTLLNGVFPLAYRAAAAWAAKDGLEGVIEAYRDEAASKPGHLGHKWTVLCGFKEALETGPGAETRALMAERFAEFAAASFGGRMELPAPPERAVAFSECLDACLARPGFLAHHLITLAYARRHASWIGPVVHGKCLREIRAMTDIVHADPEDNVSVAYSGAERASEELLEAALKALTAGALRDVHALTIADSVLELWPAADEVQKAKLVALARFFDRP